MDTNEKILILSVDDNEANLYARGRLLKREGYAVVEASNGLDALRLVAELKPPLVLCDVQMPGGINGLEVCRRIKTDPALVSTFVLQISASLIEAQDKARALDGGADAYLTDPVEPAELLATVRALLRLQRAEAELRNSQKRLALALEAGRAGTFEWDIQNNVNYWSPELEKLFGVEAGTYAGHYDVLAKTIAAEDAQRIGAEVRAALEKRQAEYAYEFRAIMPDNSHRWFGARAKFEYDAAGKPLRMIGINVDINERKQAEAERERLLDAEQKARQDAETATRLKDEFLAVVSHELRSPLNSILGWNHFLRGGADPATVSRAAEIIARQGAQQLQLIEDLLDTSRIISGKMRLNVQPVELSEVISAALDTARPAAEAKKIVLLPDFEAGAGQITGDPDRLQQIVWNLLNNAVKFTPTGGTVFVSVKRESSQLAVIVRDTGQGIEPEFLPFVFDRFRQADGSTTRRFGGLGLGLALVRHLVELHGGNVQAISAGVDLGTTFTIRFPLRAAANKSEILLQSDENR